MKMLIEQLTSTTWDKPLSRPWQLSIILHASTRESQCVRNASQAYFGLPAFLTWIVHCFRGYAEMTALFPCIDRPAAVCIRGSNNLISTCAFLGSAATCTVDRAGGSDLK